MGDLYYACEEMFPILEKIAPADSIVRIKWSKFADGTDNIFIPRVADAEGRRVHFLASFSSPSEIFRQFSAMVVLLESFCSSLTCVLPYYPTATMERVDVDGEGTVATASTLAWLFNSLPRAGIPTKVVVYDIHTLQNRFYLKGGAVARLDTAIPLMRAALSRFTGSSGANGCASGLRTVFAFPDEGASKRFTALLPDGADHAVCGKVRQEDGGRIVSLHDGARYLANADVVVVIDDLVQSGGTLLECGRVLRAVCGKKEVKMLAFVTHAVFPNRSWTKFCPEDPAERVYDKFWTTNSRPLTVAEIMADDRASKVFEVLCLAPLIAKHIVRN